jgi:long-chain acyl-CoA synthetase
VEKIWLKNYPNGIPTEIDANRYRSLVELFDEACAKHSDTVAYYNMGVSITYRQMEKLTRDFAAYLQQELKLVKGSRIAIMLPNVLQYPIVLYGALRAGITVVNINPLYTIDELTYQLNDSQAETIVIYSGSAAKLQHSLLQLPLLRNIIISDIGDMFPFFKRMATKFALKYIYKKIPDYYLPQASYFRVVLAKGASLKFNPVDMVANDVGFLQYTGGTTGVSKGAILTHGNLLANIEQVYQWVAKHITDKDLTIITALPLYHIFSLTGNCLCVLRLGGRNILITNPRDVAGMIKEISKFKFSVITGVNTLFNGLVKNPAFAKLDFSALRLALGGGMAIQEAVAEKWQEVTGKPIIQAYGLTETSPCVTMNPLDIKSFKNTIGLPMPSTDITILNDQGQEVPIGEAGELAVKGPQVMKGYWNKPEETAKVFTKDGWLLTGDIVSIDSQGFVRLLERKKDMIIVSGFNVYPNEIEDVLAKMPGIREIAVIGIYDQSSGEAVKAFVVKDNPNISITDILSFSREHLTPYKVPKHIEFCNELPKSYVGKIMRRTLRDETAKNH